MARRKGKVGSKNIVDLAYSGKTAKVRELLENEDASSLAPRLGQALVAAVCVRNEALVAVLLQHGADPNTLVDARCSVLCRALWENPAEPAVAAIVRLLLDRGASLEVRDDSFALGLTPLLSAILYCARNSPAALARAGRAWADSAGMLAGHEASGAAASGDGAAPAEPSIRPERLAVIDLLLEHGASLGERGRNGATAALLAKIEGDDELVDWLLARGATPEGLLELELHRAATEGSADDSRSYLERGADPDRRFPGRSTALAAAAENGHLEIVDLLLERGADPSLAESDELSGSFSPLFRAAYSGHLEVVRRLLEAGADPRALGPNKRRLLDYAKLGQKERLHPERPWEALIALVREATAPQGAATTVRLSEVRAEPEVIAAVRATEPTLAESSWRQAQIGELLFYESASIDRPRFAWDAMRSAAARHGFAPVLVAWSLDEVEPDLAAALAAIESVDTQRGQAMLDHLETLRRAAVEPRTNDVENDPLDAILGSAPLPTRRSSPAIEFSLRRCHVVLVQGPPETVYALCGSSHHDLTELQLASVFARWRQRHGAELAAFDGRTAHLVVTRPLRDEPAVRRQALELYLVTPELGESPRHLLELAGSRQWRLRWG